MIRLQLVVPCYNEAARLNQEAFLGFLHSTGDVAFLLVNDGSSDTTASVLTVLEARGKGRIRTLHLERNLGKAGAVRAGILASLDSGAEYVGYWDADLSTPLEAIPEFIEVLETDPAIDIVMGARVALLGRQIHRRAARHYSGRLVATAASITLGLAVYDTQCGAKLFRSNPSVRQAFGPTFRSRWIFDVEILARYIAVTGRHGIASRIYELPLKVWTDVPGSKVKMSDGLRAFWDLARIWRESR